MIHEFLKNEWKLQFNDFECVRNTSLCVECADCVVIGIEMVILGERSYVFRVYFHQVCSVAADLQT